MDEHPDGGPFAWSLMKRIAMAGVAVETEAREKMEAEAKAEAEKETELAKLRAAQDARLGRTPHRARRRR